MHAAGIRLSLSVCVCGMILSAVWQDGRKQTFGKASSFLQRSPLAVLRIRLGGQER